MNACACAPGMRPPAARMSRAFEGVREPRLEVGHRVFGREHHRHVRRGEALRDEVLLELLRKQRKRHAGLERARDDTRARVAHAELRRGEHGLQCDRRGAHVHARRAEHLRLLGREAGRGDDRLARDGAHGVEDARNRVSRGLRYAKTRGRALAPPLGPPPRPKRSSCGPDVLARCADRPGRPRAMCTADQRARGRCRPRSPARACCAPT